MDRRHNDRGSLHFVISVNELFDGAKSAAAKFLGNGVRASEIGVNNSGETDWFALLGEILIDAGVVASEDASANNCDSDEALIVQNRILG